MVEFVRTHECGQIVRPTNIRPEELIRDLSAAYPDQRLVVLGRHTRQLQRVASSLREAGISAETSHRFREDRAPQVACVLPMKAAELDFATSDLVILLDTFACSHEHMQLALSQVDARFRLFGLTKSDRRPAPMESDVAFSVFGPDLVEICGPNRIRRETFLAQIETPPPANDLPQSDAAFARRCYWTHPRRNRQILQLAKTLVDPQTASAEWMGDVARFRDGHSRRRLRVAILVDRPHHAVQLSEKLPGWPVDISDNAIRRECGSSRNRIKRLRKSEQPFSDRIVVRDMAHKISHARFDVVIWAGGGPSLDAIPTSWLSVPFDEQHSPLLIVDFEDHHNRDALRLSRRRFSAGLERDFYSVDIVRRQGRLAKFLATRVSGEVE
ncbi:hypothetical protein [Maioricimonas sp. JC845]|uniref:hypothetical protein n=1 Tax=Maioricimonas sp. JC845 TaxID=3232138 RepID=UPI0034584EB0